MNTTDNIANKPIVKKSDREIDTKIANKMDKTLHSIREDFPILKKKFNGFPLAYLDNAATTQKPQVVIDTIQEYYQEYNANVHRGIHRLSVEATKHFEAARDTVKDFINAKESRECIFTRGTTDAINLLSSSFGQSIEPGDEILVTQLEHHSNIVPWQMLCQQKGAILKVVPINSAGELDLGQKLTRLEQFITSKTKLLAVAHVSNALGTINPIKEIVQLCHAHNVAVFVDGAQAAAHLKIDVQDLDCDFYAFSGHKAYGPTGIGVLYGKSHWLQQLPPYQTGGEMVVNVRFDKTTFSEIPYKFEAGTPAIAEAIALAASLNYINQVGWDFIVKHENQLLTTATQQLSTIPGIQFIGTAKEKIGIISFTLQGVHPHDIGSIVDNSNVAIRTGHHCAMPIMDFFSIPATARVSFGIYNNDADIEQLVKALHEVNKIFKR